MAQLTIWAQWYLAPIVAIAVSLVYLLTSPPSQPVALRLAASAAGLLIAAIYGVAFAVAQADLESPTFGLLFMASLLLPVIAIVQAFRLYRGPKGVHLLQVANVMSLLWTGFVGGMAITGDWL